MSSPEPSMPVIEMRDVAFDSLRGGDAPVAEGIQWRVAEGEYWVIAGLQGSGKSDFLMMAGGVLAPRAGSYRLLGEEMPIFEEARLKHRLRLGLVFDGGQLFNQLTIRENVALPLRYHHNLAAEDAKPEVDRFLEAMGLMPWAEKTPGALGRTWRQRAGLARALVLKPEVLMVDNPLSGLDLQQAGWWVGFLDQLSKGHALMDGRPMTLIVTASDLRPWAGRDTHFAVLRDREFRAVGSWTDLERAGGELVREFLVRSDD